MIKSNKTDALRTAIRFWEGHESLEPLYPYVLFNLSHKRQTWSFFTLAYAKCSKLITITFVLLGIVETIAFNTSGVAP